MTGGFGDVALGLSIKCSINDYLEPTANFVCSPGKWIFKYILYEMPTKNHFFDSSADF